MVLYIYADEGLCPDKSV